MAEKNLPPTPELEQQAIPSAALEALCQKALTLAPGHAVPFLISPCHPAVEFLFKALWKHCDQHRYPLYPALYKHRLVIVHGRRLPTRWTDPKLYKMFLKFNRRWFGGVLPKSTVVGWSARSGINTQSRFNKQRRELVISQQETFGGCNPYGEVYGWPNIVIAKQIRSDANQVRQTMIHEMVHLELAANPRIRNHEGPTFRQRMRSLEQAGAYRRQWTQSVLVDTKTGEVLQRKRPELMY